MTIISLILYILAGLILLAVTHPRVVRKIETVSFALAVVVSAVIVQALVHHWIVH
jgi:hypothetical protein